MMTSAQENSPPPNPLVYEDSFNRTLQSALLNLGKTGQWRWIWRRRWHGKLSLLVCFSSVCGLFVICLFVCYLIFVCLLFACLFVIWLFVCYLISVKLRGALFGLIWRGKAASSSVSSKDGHLPEVTVLTIVLVWRSLSKVQGWSPTGGDSL